MVRETGLRPDRRFAPVDPASLVVFRAAFGLLLFVLVLRYFAHGWIDAQFHEPAHFFTWPGFGWVRPWPWPWMHAHFAALGALALLLAAGLFTRPAALLFCLGFTVVQLIDRTNYLNHYYLVSLLSFLLAVMPSARLRPASAVPAWTLWLLRFQVGVVYLFAGLAKLQEDWLLRAQPLRLWLAHAADLPVVGPLLGETFTAYVLSWAGMLFDLSAPFLLLWRRSRPFAFAGLVAFHLATAILFPIGLFPWIMIVGALVFLPPDWPRGWLRTAAPRLPEPAPRPGLAVQVLLSAYVLLQLALPLRQGFARTEQLWSEAGSHFAWRVMLVEKTGHVRFTARDPRTGRDWEVRPGEYLTPVQEHFMAFQPDLIRDFGRFVAGDFARRGLGAVEVRAEAWVSMNGRPARRLGLD